VSPSSTPTDFTLDAALDAQIRVAGEWIASARHVVALTGAGLSVESGIPPFRGPGGIWTQYGEPPMDGYQRFLRDPRAAWLERLSPKEAWMRALGDAVRAAKPNPGHLAFVELERRGRLAALITQNIDDLHRQAGHANVLEIHGNHRLLRCIDCNARFDPSEIEVDPEHLPPLCPSCRGLVKTDIVHFGEPIPSDVLRACFAAVAEADLMIVAGTSATVYPAAEFPYEVLRAGGRVIEVNLEPSELTPAATTTLLGPGATLLPRLLDWTVRAEEASA
jgi:NAD-dependent deacetylase